VNKSLVLVVEGEKAADAAARMFPTLAVVTSPAGAKAAKKADWTPLQHHNVTIWPDHDGPGLEFAGEVHALLKELGVTARVVDVPSTWPNKWDLADPPPFGVGPADLVDMIDQAQPWNGQDDAPPQFIEVFTWTDFKGKPVPPPEYDWEPYFPKVPFGLLASHPGHGKSILSLQVAVAKAVGLPLFGHPTGQAGGVGVLALEDDKNVVHRRLQAIVTSYGDAWSPAHERRLEANFRLMVRARRPIEDLATGTKNLHLAGLAHDLGQVMKTTQDAPALLFLDTLNAVNEGDENSAAEARPLIDTLYGLHDALGCSPWALHHLRKAGVGRQAPQLMDRMDPELPRGTGAFVGSSRATVQFGWILPAEAGKANLDPTNSHRRYAILGLTKVNDGPLSPWLLLEHSENAGLWVPTPHGDQALAALRGGKAVEELTKAEELLVDIHAGLDRPALAAKHYPGDPKAGEKLKGAIQDLRRRRNWIQKGALELTVQGFDKVRELGRQAPDDAYLEGSEDEHLSHSA
jgi:hypothetical protein